MTSNIVLKADNVVKRYGKKLALDHASLDLKKGEILSLLGPNGAGKTTFIKILVTLLKKDEGTVNVLGFDLDKDEHAIKHVLGYVGQDTERSAYARLTGRENLRFFGALRGLKKDEVDEKIGFFENYFEFDGILDKLFMHLSGGQKQAIIIMRAFLHDPPILFLDEPTKGLDPITSKKIREFLKDIVHKQGKSLFLTSHIMSEVDFLSDRVALIDKGKIAIIDTPTGLKEQVGVNDFIDIQRSEFNGVTNDILHDLKHLDSVVKFIDADENMISLGVKDLFDGFSDVINVFKKYGVRPKLSQHQVSLEDAFIYHVGKIERFT